MKGAGTRVQYGVRKTLYPLFMAAVIMLSLPGLGKTEELKPIKLNEPGKKRGLPFMEALSVNASAQDALRRGRRN